MIDLFIFSYAESLLLCELLWLWQVEATLQSQCTAHCSGFLLQVQALSMRAQQLCLAQEHSL